MRDCYRSFAITWCVACCGAFFGASLSSLLPFAKGIISLTYSQGFGKERTKQLCKLFFVGKAEAERNLNKAELRERMFHLYPPGTIYHFVRNDRGDLELELSSYERFSELVISPAMFKDHMPHNYEKAFKKVLNPNDAAARKFARRYSMIPFKKNLLTVDTKRGITVRHARMACGWSNSCLPLCRSRRIL